MANRKDKTVNRHRTGHHPWLRRLWRITAGSLAAVVIVVAIVIGLLRFSAPMVPAWRADAERMIAEAIGYPVRIGELDLQFEWLQPEIVFRDVALLEPESRQPLVTAAQLSVIIEASDLLHVTELRPHRIRILSPQTAITITEDEQVLVGGFALPEGESVGGDWRDLLELVLQRADIDIRDANIRFQYLSRDIEDWEIRDLDVSFSSDGESHAISINLLPPSLLGKAFELNVDANGPPRRPEEWQWQVSAQAASVDIATLRQQVRWPGLGNFSGTFDLTGEFSGKGARDISGNGQLLAEDLLFGGLSDAPEPIERLAFDWNASHQASASELNFENVELTRQGESWPATHLSLDWQHPESAVHRLQLVSNYLSLEALRVIAASMPRGVDADDWTLFDWIAEVRPEGEVRGLILDVPLDVPLDESLNNSASGWRIEGEITDLHTRAVRGLPGIDGLSGRISGLRESGVVRLDGRDMEVRMPDIFRDPIPVTGLDVQAGWRRLDDRWRFTTDQLELDFPILGASGSVQLDLPDGGEPVIDMTATASNVDIEQTSAFLPVGVMSDDLVKWLDRGMVNGEIPEANIRWQGAVSEFPYREGEGDGEFNIAFTLQDTVIEYVPGWPRIEGLLADVEFFGPGMNLEIREGRTGKLRLESGRAQFREFRENLLEIQANISGDTGDMEDFVKASPLRDRLQGVTDSLELKGPARADVNINVPVMHSRDTSLEIDLELDAITAQPTMLPWPIEELTGTVRITEQGAWAESLQGVFHGNTVKASLNSELQAEAAEGERLRRVTIHSEGTALVDKLDQWLPEHWRPSLSGSLEFMTDVNLPVHAEGVPTVSIQTSLANMASNLPLPLTKPAGLAWPAQFELAAPEKGRLSLQGSVRNDMSFRLAFLRGQQEWYIERGQVEFGSSSIPLLPDSSGIFIRGKLNAMAPLQWVELERKRPAVQPDAKLRAELGDDAGESTSLRQVDVSASQMLLSEFVFPDQVFSLTRMPASWNIALDGEKLRGSAVVPLDAGSHGRLELDLDRVYLDLPEGVEIDGSDTDPRDFPATQVDIRDFRIGRIRLGHLEGFLKRSNIGFVTDNLTATGPAHRITASGRWEYLDDGHYTSVKADMTSSDLEAALSALGYRAGVEADDASATMDLTWHAPPFGWAPERLNGEVSLDFKDGRIEEVSQGAGRVFGLLSIGALPRRLLLDFSDVFESGLPFDTLQGDFIITDGSAYTTNLRMKGPSMAALIVGRTGIAAKDYDQLVIVDPNVSGSLPLAGALAAGPNVGAAILLLSQLLKAPLSDIAQVKYRITGSWEDPEITRVEGGKPPAKATGDTAGSAVESAADSQVNSQADSAAVETIPTESETSGNETEVPAEDVNANAEADASTKTDADASDEGEKDIEP